MKYSKLTDYELGEEDGSLGRKSRQPYNLNYSLGYVVGAEYFMRELYANDPLDFDVNYIGIPINK